MAAERDNLKPEKDLKPAAAKPEAPTSKGDDSYAHALSLFAQSLAYSGAEAPSRGVAQLVDHLAGTKFDEAVQKKFTASGIHKPEEAKYGTKAWTAEQLGGAIGMVAPMWLARKTMVGKAEGTVAKDASLFARTSSEANFSARTGFLYGFAFTPTDNQDSNAGFWQTRAMQGVKDTAVFGTMGATAKLTGESMMHTASSLEASALPAAFKSPIKTALQSSLVHGAVAGLPGGILQAQFGAIESGKTFASLQDFKENIASNILVGGAMGGANLFGKSSSLNSLKSLELQEPSSTISATTSATTSIERPASSAAKAPHEFDIKFDPIKTAWDPSFVDQHKSIETRSIDFSPADTSTANKDWSKFREWGVSKRDVSTNVYRFPGLSTEIVVPSDYAKILDEIRSHRFNDIPFTAGPGSNPDVWIRGDRILPEEMAQMLMRMPQPELAKSVQLLDHGNPWDVKKTHERQIAAEARGEIIGPRHTFMSQADAATHTGTLRVFDISTNDATEFHDIAAHEYSHLAEKEPVFESFPAAAHAERDGFYSRDYARENDNENWAVHLGENFLSPDGAAFAALPEKAPARTLVMAKAVRNMLAARAANPGPRHQEFTARVEAADALATANLQKGIQSDFAAGDMAALADKLKFLNVAATSGQSPEILARVLNPIKRDLIPLLLTSGDTARDARAAFRDSVAIGTGYTPKN